MGRGVKTSQTVLRIFKPSLMHILEVFRSDAWSGKSVSCILWELTLPQIRLVSVLVVVVFVVVYLTGMALKTGVLETHLTDIVGT